MIEIYYGLVIAGLIVAYGILLVVFTVTVRRTKEVKNELYYGRYRVRARV